MNGDVDYGAAAAFLFASIVAYSMGFKNGVEQALSRADDQTSDNERPE